MSEKKKTRRGLVGLLLVLALARGGAAVAQTGNLAKIAPELQERIHLSRDANETFRVIIEMAEQYDNPNLERGTALMTRAQRREFVVNELKRFSEGSQADVMAFLNERATRNQVNVLHRFWIFNGICCEATAVCIGELSMRSDVRYMALDDQVELDDAFETEPNNRGYPPEEGVQWHVSKVRANEVWTYNGTSGYTGAGVVVAILDTGVNYRHADISGNMWDGVCNGENGEVLYPNHGWDFVDNDNDPFDGDVLDGHGSHVAGIVAGNNSVYQSGIAPGSTIMAIRVVGDNQSLDAFFTNTLCGLQFALEYGADVINASWGYNRAACLRFYREAMEVLLTAGVVVTKSAGNFGSKQTYHPVPNNISAPGGCPPPWHNPDQLTLGGASALICVGNTTQDDLRNATSSIGPVTWQDVVGYEDYEYLPDNPNATGLIRPDVSAPGKSIWSINRNDNEGYHTLSGTSMASPCVAGVIALMLEANPNLTPSQIDEILESTAVPCDGQTSKNNYYGAGRVDAYEAVTAALNLNTPQRYHINVAKFPFEDRFFVSGSGHYLAGSSCTIMASPTERFDRWEKDGEIVSNSAAFTIEEVTEDAEYIGFFYEGEIITEAFPAQGGSTSGDGMFHAGDLCTVTATPNPGFTFMGWYGNALGTMLYSRQPEYTFTVTRDRHLYAKFVLGNYTVTTSCSPAEGGSVTGGGTYMVGSTVTLTATANSGYVFSCWTEDGQVVSSQPTYSFTSLSDRHLVANFMQPTFSLGTLITNPDGSKGIVFYINPTYTGGCMVALEDVSTDCPWGNDADVTFVRNYTYTRNECLLSDLDGYANTAVLRENQSANPDYAPGRVDFEHGWYVPSAGQLRKIFSALPFIESAITNAGGTTLSDNGYWSSTENSASNAWSSTFELSSYSKTSNRSLRAVRDFSINNTLRVQVSTNNAELGNATGSGFYSIGAQVTVTATPTGDNLFRGWTEKGHLVSQDPTYTFSAYANRDLVANFAVRGGVGTLVTNPDGSQGVLFHVTPDGSQGWMVALEDASEGCQWGPESDIIIMKDQTVDCQSIFEDQSGYYNTKLIRMTQGTDNEYAASIVDFDNGWYLPSAGQLRKLYAELPMLEEALLRAGGSSLTDGAYWSSTEYSASAASTPGFALGTTSKTSNCRVRAIHNYIPDGDHVVFVASNDENFGTVSGEGEYDYNETVTVTATPNEGYQFDHWTENGVTVSYDAEYQFPFTDSRSLVANFMMLGSIGSLIHNLDGSLGVVFYVNTEGTEGLMVALEDVADECPWGTDGDILVMPDVMYTGPYALCDSLGTKNTDLLRRCQGTETGYAADMVDVDNGWFLPSSGQLRKLYAALPLIEEQLVFAGGGLLTGDTYWSSTEYSPSNALSPMFEMSNSGKTANHRVRAVRSFLVSGVHSLVVKANDASFGSVTGSGEYEYGATVTVAATPNEGFVFDHWTEDGATVSYDATYQFTFTRNRSLVAHFVRTGSVGSIITNADGSRGVVFYSDPSGIGGLMVALDDASEGCPWGINEDIVPLENWNPGQTQNMLEDMSGYENTWIIRNWQSNNPDYAAGKVDYSGSWFLPSAGQMRKLYAALPLIEEAIVCAGGSLMTENLYWTSSENSSNQAWSPSFEFTKTNKTTDLRVRAIRSIMPMMMITATSNPEEGGTVSGAGAYDNGATCTLTAAPNEHFAFVNWTKDGQQVSTSASYTFTVTEAADYVANFELNSYDITATANPDGGGTVTGSGTYGYGEAATLTAMANEGYSFQNWTENGEEVCAEAIYNFTVTGNRDLVANFVEEGPFIPTEDLVAYYPFDGDVNDYSGNDNHGTIIGNVVPVTDRHGNPHGAYRFPGVPFNYISVPDAEILHLNSFTLSAWVYTDAEDYGSGTLINKGRDINNGSYRLNVRGVGATTQYGGTNDASVEENPAIGQWHMITGTVEGDQARYYLDGVLLAENTLSHPFSYNNTQPLTLGVHYYEGVPSNWAYTLLGIIDEVRIYSRVFTPQEVQQLYGYEETTYDIEAVANPEEGGMVEGAGTYIEGSVCTLTAIPNENFTFTNWTRNGQMVSTTPTYSFTVIDAGSYVANFHQNICTVTVTANPSDGGTVTGSGTYDYGTQVTLTATASEGYTFVNWTANGALLSTSPTCTLTVTGDTDCVARFLSGDGVVQTGSFTSGWNWWNTYIEQGGMDGLQMLEDGLGSNGIQIKSQQQYTNYYEGMGWMGMLSAIDNESTYKIKTNAACMVDMVGLETTSEQHPITIVPGWNWIGYPVNSSMSVATAFSNVTPASGDQVKAQNGYANYYDGMGWMGTLSTIEPGMGILYKSNGSGSFTLVYPTNSKGETLVENITSENNHWVPDMHAYPDNMTVTAIIELDDDELQSDNYELAAFADGECRGSVRLMYVEPLNRHIAFLTITGEDVTALSFSLYDTQTGEEIHGANEQINFSNNATVGDVRGPYVLHFRGITGVDEWANRLNVFPNPVARGEVLNIVMPTEDLGEMRVEIINALGVVEACHGASLQTITAPDVAGVYTLHITVEGKGTCYRKLVVK
jgi:subtilisin family serine protease